MVTMKRSFYITTSRHVELFDNKGRYIALIVADDERDGIRIDGDQLIGVQHDGARAVIITFNKEQPKEK